MKRKLTLLLICGTFTILSCKKEGSRCWRCEMSGTYGGVNYNGQVKDTCTPTGNKPEIMDASGTRIASDCKQKF